jgi:hypothetical protein
LAVDVKGRASVLMGFSGALFKAARAICYDTGKANMYFGKV